MKLQSYFKSNEYLAIPRGKEIQELSRIHLNTQYKAKAAL